MLTAEDPPYAPLIAVTQQDGQTVVIRGEAGAVFPAAQVAVRNVYTGDTVFASAAANGSFQATLNGTDAMPYQVNTARAYPLAERDTYNLIPGSGVIVYPPTIAENNFSIGGELSYGASYWLADGTLNALNYEPGDEFSLALNARLFAPDSDPSLMYTLRGELALRRLFDAEGRALATDAGAGMGWSSELLLGLPVLGHTQPDTPLAQSEPVHTQATFPPDEEATEEPTSETIIPGEITVSLELSGTMPEAAPGWYGLVFSGTAAIGDSQPFDWYANRVFSAAAPETEGDSATMLPLLLQIGDAAAPRLLWSVLNTVATEDSDQSGTANLIHHTPENPVFMPGTYSLEPRLYSSSLPPLVSGNIRLRSENASASVSAYPALRDGLPYLETYDEGFAQEFLASGDVQEIDVSGTVEDAFGQRYTGGGTYTVQFAEPLTIHSPILAGTPFVIGQSFPANFTISPHIPDAEKRVTLRFLTRDGALNERAISEDFTFTEPGIYVVDFHAQAEANETAWAASQRIAGVVTAPDSATSGVRGLANYARSPQVWYDTEVFPADARPTLPILNFPFFPGDVVSLPDSAEAALNPLLGNGATQLLSVVHPGLRVRQFVRADEAELAAWFTADELLEGPIGAGSEGLRPDDVLLLFGGALDSETVRGYAASAVITGGNSARVAPPFTQPLLQDRGEDVWLFVQPTGIRPGDVIPVGETVRQRGYSLPTLPTEIQTHITQPDGVILQQTLLANDYGYFEGEVLSFEQPGVYLLRTAASFSGETSAGIIEDAVSGGVLGVDDGYFAFAVPEDAPALETSLEAITQVQQPFSIPLRVPEGWTEVTWYTVVRTPQWVLDHNTEPLTGSQASYFFDAGLLARTFPFLENRASTASDRDEITFTFAMTGIDESDEAHIRARTFTLRGNTLYTFED